MARSNKKLTISPCSIGKSGKVKVEESKKFEVMLNPASYKQNEGITYNNTGSEDPGVLREYLLSKKFKLAGFKGVALTFRDWNGQLRQPILVVGPRMLVTVSPQKGFLHERSELDTLGYDKPESGCHSF